MPTVCRLTPDVEAVTAHFKMAPMAINKMLTVSPTGCPFLTPGATLQTIVCYPRCGEVKHRPCGVRKCRVVRCELLVAICQLW